LFVVGVGVFVVRVILVAVVCVGYGVDTTDVASYVVRHGVYEVCVYDVVVKYDSVVIAACVIVVEDDRCVDSIYRVVGVGVVHDTGIPSFCRVLCYP